MPLVFIIAQDWKLRTSVRAELRERGIDALGMDSPDDVGRAIASRQTPALVVLEGTAEFVCHPGIQSLITRLPALLIASRTERIPLRTHEQGSKAQLTVLYRPVRVGDVVSQVMSLLEKGQAA
jgi:hypothetical protein